LARTPSQQAQRFVELAMIDVDPLGAAANLAESSESRSIEVGTPVFTEGDACAHLAFLLGGCVRVFKQSGPTREVTLYRVLPGEACVLTTCSVLRQSEFPAVAIVEETVDALVVPAPVFRRWFDLEASWRSFVLNLFADRLEHMLGLVDSVVFRRTDARISRVLLARLDVDDGVTEITHEQLAQEVGTAREVVSRILEKFAANGVIATERGRVRILDTEHLSKIARG